MKLNDLHQLPDLSHLLAELAATAAQRDQQGGHPAHEKALIARTGLLPLVIPTQYGGAGASWADAFAAVRAIAAVDSALGHLLAFQYLQTATVTLYGSDAQRERFLRPTAELGWWWGNAVNPVDHRLRAQRSGSGWTLDGEKGFCSGTLGSNMMVVSAHDTASGQPVIAVVPTARYGITVRDDWHPIGQRQTDSTSVQFRHVQVSDDEVLAGPDTVFAPHQTLRSCIAQTVLVNLYTGIAEGALEEARRHTQQSSRPWFASGVERVADDPYQLHRFGEMRVQWLAAAALADRAIQRLDSAWRKGVSLTADERAEVSLATAEAKVVAHRAALFIGQELFEATGARSTKAALALDRFWRNARTHTLHDPLDYKLRAIGRYALEGVLPEATVYS
ncbi:acyl-CoA dehydrogenase family protein [uncultured Ralstonia sp.]|jgi:alkylation response protein AidB-like acyl-CoA dehydrogenase|uniref:acyl-CoA dehydrogenase family protein n=1 Tax=uncultured Ralstonia sp. TaxID=114715 RepID=UPI001EA725B0|nr:acyl-CoA dehydrogenase family protein [uncultured Ralstonia sp.]UCF25040.1 MAG: acyl-CoA dehydrogenase family protein [Ralstonia sp.]